ncbi:MAG TPA: zinc-dependent alcohol dehydrogenase family protein [Ktedonosporobacter sp.]|nr:zinc-dependent alcohol dehydrogenase family protein [Ktedonosporobacter sp.]
MRATVFHNPRDVRIENVPDPTLQSATDAIVRITHACICGSDLWPYRGMKQWKTGWRLGHEWMGIVEETGSEVSTVKRGDYVLAPFVFSDGTCEFCLNNLHTSCTHGAIWGKIYDGGQAEAVRVPFADGTLVVLLAFVKEEESLLTALLPPTDVMGTGHHAALSAGIRPGSTVVIVGDGAVGLCGILAARRLGAERIMLLGHHHNRLALVQHFGATDVIMSLGKQEADEVFEQLKGGAESVIECVGTKSAMDMAIRIARPGGNIGYVGVPQGSENLDLERMFAKNITLRGGIAPVRAYIPELLPDVLAGKLDPSPIFDLITDLYGVPDGYVAMDQRTAIKVMIRP